MGKDGDVKKFLDEEVAVEDGEMRGASGGENALGGAGGRRVVVGGVADERRARRLRHRLQQVRHHLRVHAPVRRPLVSLRRPATQNQGRVTRHVRVLAAPHQQHRLEQAQN